MNNRVPELRDSLSKVPFRISMCFKDIQLAIGTAFTYSYEGQLYLVTNWHNVIGREPSTLKLKSRDAAIPDRLHIEIPIMVEASGAKQSETEMIHMEWREAEFLLYEDICDSPTKPVWYEHPQYGYKVDVVVAPINFPEEVAICPANDQKLNLSTVLLRPSLDVFVLGFPMRNEWWCKTPCLEARQHSI